MIIHLSKLLKFIFRKHHYVTFFGQRFFWVIGQNFGPVYVLLAVASKTITKYINWQQFMKGTRGKPNEQLFPRQVVIQLPKIY